MAARSINKKSVSKKPRSSRSRPKKVDVEFQDIPEYRQFIDDSREKFSTWYGKSSSKYIVAGVAATALIPLALKIYRSFPKLSLFVRENLDSVEDGIKSYKHRGDQNTRDAHH